MKPLLLKIESNVRQSFQIRKDSRPSFYSTWHYHEELELVLILKSSGTRFVGDSIQPFSAGDLVLVGENVPHVWKNSDSEYQESPDTLAEAIVIHFRKDFAGPEFFGMPEMKNIEILINEAKRGLSFSGRSRSIISEKIKSLLDKSPFDRILGLLDILNTICDNKDFQALSTPDFISSFVGGSNNQINRVHAYIIENFRTDEITLEKAAELANLTPSAFCRFFKSRTRKTFTQYLIEVRISFACRQLMEGKMDVLQVCFDCGFNNLSYFNRQFKLLTKETPSSYKNKHKPALV